jgi:hypothetical protein
MRRKDVAVVAVFTGAIVGSDFALAPYADVKLLDTLVFVAAFVFGFRVGALVAVLSETIWGFVSPYGIAGAVLPFLVGGELLFAFAGYAASKLWAGPEMKALSAKGLFFGAVLTICAFAWDFETNIATGLLAGASTLTAVLSYEIPGIPFMIAHELSDFAFGLLVVPAVIAYSWRLVGGKGALGAVSGTGPLRGEKEG